jgi:hypothetical protein
VGVFLALAVGYVIGARAGSRDLDDVTDALRALRDSQEMADLSGALRSHLGHTLRELATLVEGTGGSAQDGRRHQVLVPRDRDEDVVERVTRLFERK